MSKMVMMAHLIKDNQGSLTEKLYKDLSRIDYIIKGHMEKHVLQCNQYVLPVRQQSASPERQSRSRTQNTFFNTEVFSSNYGTSICCYYEYFNKTGHSVKDCYSQAICGNCHYQGQREKYLEILLGVSTTREKNTEPGTVGKDVLIQM